MLRFKSLARAFSTSIPKSTPAYTSTLPSPSTIPYPFSSIAKSIPSVPRPPPKTDNLMRTLNAHLTTFHPNATNYLSLFSRSDSNRLLSGSVITVSSYMTLPTAENPNPSTNSFSGVLIAVRRRHAGRDTSFRLRNLVGKTGVEVSFKLFSPLLANIKIVARATNSGPKVILPSGLEANRKLPALKAAKRAKMYFVRDQPQRLVSVGGIIKQAREKELLAEKRKR